VAVVNESYTAFGGADTPCAGCRDGCDRADGQAQYASGPMSDALELPGVVAA